MKDNVKSHKEYVNQQLAKDLTDDQRQQLYQYHLARVKDFQHERLIHLLVTFFFGFLTISAIVACPILATLVPELTCFIFALAGILLILEICYVAHYYRLENGVQSLYEITIRLR